MPQMRATISGTSVYSRPSSSFSNIRGGSKMRSRRSSIVPSRTRSSSLPSPSTRASTGTWIVIWRFSVIGGTAPLQTSLGKGGRGPVDEKKTPRHRLGQQPQSFQATRERFRVRILGRTVTGITVAPETRAQRSAAAACHRSHAWNSFRHHHAHALPALAFQANLVLFIPRRHAEQQRAHGGEQLAPAHRTTPQLEVNLHMS